WPLTTPKGKSSGELHLLNYKFTVKESNPKIPTLDPQNHLALNNAYMNIFMDFIRGGEQLNFMTAIDFTGSNGDPSSSKSLHYLDKSGNLNQYQSALLSVGEIVINYDYDKTIPSFGFGAKT